MLKVFPNGFQITFENGYTVSVMFDEHNYCSNRTSGIYVRGECINAEVAIFTPNGGTVPVDGDVAGWASPERVAELIGIAAQLDAELEMEFYRMEVENTIEDLEADYYDNQCHTGSNPDA